ncbi:hypothetical protein [Allomuricauda sp. d1]|uniref:hypothetical protein n=1 Tax=Allomuricauda sp. d1 TaxID=3136725 RepID=UPI0031D7D928
MINALVVLKDVPFKLAVENLFSIGAKNIHITIDATIKLIGSTFMGKVILII